MTSATLRLRGFAFAAWFFAAKVPKSFRHSYVKRRGPALGPCDPTQRRKRHERDLAGDPLRGMARNLLRASSVLPGSRQISAGADAVGQPFVARGGRGGGARARGGAGAGRRGGRGRRRARPAG